MVCPPALHFCTGEHLLQTGVQKRMFHMCGAGLSAPGGDGGLTHAGKALKQGERGGRGGGGAQRKVKRGQRHGITHPTACTHACTLPHTINHGPYTTHTRHTAHNTSHIISDSHKH